VTKSFLAENVQYFQHLKLISKKITCLCQNPGKKKLSVEREMKKGVYICFACRRELFFCSLVFYWEIPSNVLFNSEKCSQPKRNIV